MTTQTIIKFLTASGAGSRRQMTAAIKAGRVAPGYVKDRSEILIMDNEYITLKNAKDTFPDVSFVDEAIWSRLFSFFHLG